MDAPQKCTISYASKVKALRPEEIQITTHRCFIGYVIPSLVRGQQLASVKK